MEHSSHQQEHQSTELESSGPSGGGMSLSPPDFNLTASPAQLQVAPDSPIQRQEADEGTLSNETEGPQAEGQQLDNAQAQQTTQVNLDGTVGDGGDNRPEDVREVQNRLHALGYLSDADFQAEQVDPEGATPIAGAELARTIAAISRFSVSAVGRPLLMVRPNEISQTLLNQAPTQPVTNDAVGGTVGAGGNNNAADVRMVQARLLELGHLDQANFSAEEVAQDATGAIPEADLTETIAAIQDFNINVTGTSLRVIRPNGLEQATLNTPPRFQTDVFSLSGSVGTGATNNVADVGAVQRRLNGLGYLSNEALQAESPAPGVETVGAGSLAQTISALNAFQEAMGINQNGTVQPGEETHRQLMNPALASQTDVGIGGSVGDGGQNLHADVRRIQNRLHDLGFLSTEGYLAERVDATGQGAVNMTNVPQTMSAIRSFQTQATGGSDGRIDANGRTESMLNNPTHGTLTNVNPESTNLEAAADLPNASAALQRIIDAIEAGEGGDLEGEAPAFLTNGSGTAASFGSAQMIGTTAVGTLQNNDAIAEHYGLTDGDLDEMADMGSNATQHYNDIYDLVPMGTSQARLSQLIATYKTNHGETFNEETGLGLDDIDRMFHTANMRRRINNGQGANNGDVSTSATAAGISARSVRHYVANRTHMGENRAGFGTQAVMSHEKGQELRNAMTDGGGQTIGRLLIRDNFNAATGAVRQGGNRERNIAIVTALMHNRGETAGHWAGRVNGMLGDRYVVNFLSHW